MEHIYGHNKTRYKNSWSKGIEIIQSLFSYPYRIMLEISIKRYLKITHIFSSAMRHLPKEIFDSAIESGGAFLIELPGVLDK